MSEATSQNHDASSPAEAIVAQDFPTIESGSESGVFNRLKKFTERICQQEWISEFDLFSTPVKLNYNGQDCYKTEFGGIVYLLIGLCTVLISLQYRFPNGLVLNNPITYYSLHQDSGDQQTLFDHTDTFFQLRLYNAVQKNWANDSEIGFLIRNVSLIQVVNNKSKQLLLSSNCETGFLCFKNSQQNLGAFIYGSGEASYNATLNMEIAHCAVYDSHPDVGLCLSSINNYILVVEATSFKEETGGLVASKEKIIYNLGTKMVATVDTNIYTTNNYILGYLANIFSYDLQYYVPNPESFTAQLPQYDSTLDCFDFNTYSGSYICTFTALVSSGTLNVLSQNFDDVTAPLMFVLSVSQTLFYLCYLLFLRNYSNNALYLRLADSLVYVPGSNGRHLNFKSGWPAFLACLLHKHFLVNLLDWLLYAAAQRQVKKLLPVQVQLAFEMIGYGEKCLGEDLFFGRINSAYEQENLQPTKIVFEEEQEVQEDQEEQEQGKAQYFKGEIESEAFRRMCEEHEYYSPQRKSHLSSLLKRRDKNHKLVLMVQQQFDNYCRQLRTELGNMEQNCPVNFYCDQEDLSGHALHLTKL